MPLHTQATWGQRLAADRQGDELRCGQGLEQARQAAVPLAARWPEIRQVGIFASVLGAGFREHSDLDLPVEGLAAAALIEGLALAEQQGAMAVDLKRAEDLGAELPRRWLRCCW